MSEYQFPNSYETSLKAEINELMPQWHAELRELLPSLPETINIEFEEDCKSPGYGTDGATLTPDTIKLGIDPTEPISHDELMKNFKGTFFHEHYHLARGYNFKTTKGLTLLEHAIEEGFATKFEMIHVGTKPGYGDYQSQYSHEEIIEMFNEVKNLTSEDGKDWEKWKFYHPEKDRRWILYRVGAFITDEVLTNNPDLKIEDLASMSHNEILEKSRLTS